MKRITLLLFMLAGYVSAATLTLVPTGQPGDYTEFATAYAAMNATDTLQVGVTVTGPVTLAKGTFDKHPVYAGGFTSSSTDDNTGSILFGGSVTLSGISISNSSVTTGRALNTISSNPPANLNVQNCYIENFGTSASIRIVLQDSSYTSDFTNNLIKSPNVNFGSTAAVIMLWAGKHFFSRNIVTGNKMGVNGLGIYVYDGSSRLSELNQNIFYGFNFGINAEGITQKNNVFLGNVTAVISNKKNALYMGLNGDITAYGSGCVSINASTAFVNPNPSQLQDFIPRHDSPIARSGVWIEGMDKDILGNPWHNPPSMGAIQCPTSGQDWFYETFQEVSR